MPYPTIKDTYFWWLVANRIFAPSYISLQSALHYYGFIPEAVFQITSITTKRTRSLDGPQIRFIYRNIKPQVYFGYTLLPYRNRHHIRMATPEKAILDVLYLENAVHDQEDFEAWRFNREEIKKNINKKTLEQYARLLDNKACYQRFETFKKWLYA